MRHEEQQSLLDNYAIRFLALRYVGGRKGKSQLDHEDCVAFAVQMRDGCNQDILRLIENCVEDCPTLDGKEALRILGATLIHEGTESWGLPDCACAKPNCVYCSRGLAFPPKQKENADD